MAFILLQMPRQKYTRKTSRASWSEKDMERALKTIHDKVASIRKTAQMFNIPYGTLQDRLKGRFATKKYKMGRKSVFTVQQEEDLAKHVINLSRLFYGLTSSSIRKLAFEFAQTNKIKNTFNKEKAMCGKDWFYAFMRRNPTLSCRKPEATSLSRVLAFNKDEVTIFYDNLDKLYSEHTFEAHRIFNVDETGISNVHVPSRIIAQKGQKQVGAVTSGERGQLVTVVVAMSAAGSFVPPMFIFKRKRMKEALERNGPTGAVYRCSKSGWITEEIFEDWIQHFAKFTKASKDDPVLLLMDNHSTHSTLRSYHYCRDNGIKVVSVPPHTSHRLQPLDVGFFGPLKSAYNQECDRYIKARKHEKILQTDIAELFKTAFNKVAAVEKGVKAFETTGIYPFNRSVFSDEEFSTLLVDPAPNAEQNQEPIIAETNAITRLEKTLHPVPGPSKIKQHDPPSMKRALPISPTSTVQQPSPLKAPSPIPGPSKTKRHRTPSFGSESSELELEEIVDDELTDDDDPTLQLPVENRSFAELLPLPTVTTRTKSRKTKHSQILTSTPLKEELENKEEKKQQKLKKLEKQKDIKQEKLKKASRRIVPEKKDNSTNADICSVCQEFGKSNEVWWRCRSCAVWTHADCTIIENAKDYVCSKC